MSESSSQCEMAVCLRRYHPEHSRSCQLLPSGTLTSHATEVIGNPVSPLPVQLPANDPEEKQMKLKTLSLHHSCGRPRCCRFLDMAAWPCPAYCIDLGSRQPDINSLSLSLCFLISLVLFPSLCHSADEIKYINYFLNKKLCRQQKDQ